MRILVIEDDEGIARLVRRGMENAGFDVDRAADGRQGLEMALEKTYSLILLDLMLPGVDGWRICREVREAQVGVPILMLTAKDTVEDRIRGLDLGADDYLPKPFDFRELLARARSLLRRDKVHRTRVITIADLVVDTAQRRVTRAGAVIGLSHREYELLEALAANQGRVLTRDVIQERVWMDEDILSNSVDVYINLLRKKIDNAHDVKLIQTVRGRGYTLRLPDGEGAA